MNIFKIFFFSLWVAIYIDVPQEELDIVEDSSFEAQEWLENAWRGKVNRSKDRIIRKEIEQSLGEGSPIPNTKEEIIEKHLNRPGYKKRRDRNRIGVEGSPEQPRN